jgi:dihydrofolate reductase
LTRRHIDLPSIAYVVARSLPHHIIGCDNKLPWHLKSDMARFKATTSGHVVIMGRKTHESIGRVLPNRLNIVISRQGGPDAPGLLWVRDRESALFLADHFSIKWSSNTIFVVGGGEIYRVFSDLFNKIYLTEVHAPSIVGDSHFDFKFDLRRWAEVGRESHFKSEVDEFDFDFLVYERRTLTVRQTELSLFLKEEARISDFLSDSRYVELSASARRETRKANTLAAELESQDRRRRHRAI